MAMADSRFPAYVRELAKDKAILKYCFGNSDEMKDYLVELDSYVKEFAMDKYGLTGTELETYLKELEVFGRFEFLTDKEKVSKAGEECSICLQNLNVGDEALTLSCSHTFHDKCMSGWLERKQRSCPLCRSDHIKKTLRGYMGDFSD